MIKTATILCGVLVTSFGALPACYAEESAALRLIQTIALPNVKGRIDHFAWDGQGERLFLTALGNDTAEVIDLKAGRQLETIKGLHEPQGILFLSEFNQVIIANGKSGMVDVFDGTSFKRLGRIALSDDADNMRYDDKTKLVYVGFGDGGLAAIDPRTMKQAASMGLGSHPEAFQLESSRPRIYVNLPPRKIAVVDTAANRVLTNWSLADLASANFPMALDEGHHRLFVGTRQPAKLLALDTESGKVIANLSTVGDADDIFYDPYRKRLYVTGGEGHISVIDQIDADHYRSAGDVSTAAGARTSLFVPQTSRLYVAVPHRSSQPSEIRVYQVQ